MVSTLISMDSFLSFRHSVNRYVLCFFVWEASAPQDMVQWSPPDVRLTLRGQITKRKYILLIQNMHKYTIALLNTSAVLFIWIHKSYFHGLYLLIWWVNFGENVSQRVNDRIESFSRWGYIIASACCKLSCYNSSLALFIVAYSHTGYLKILTTDFLFFDRHVCGSAISE